MFIRIWLVLTIFYHFEQNADKVADYDCDCEEGWGGKNCSVELTGCREEQCFHGGTCTPWCSGECGVDEQFYNCTCPNGYHGKQCQTVTTFSLYGDSYVKIPSKRYIISIFP